MTEQVQEQFSDSSHATEASMGFFEKTLHRQLDLSDQGFLKLESPSGKNTFGSDKKDGLQADLKIHRNEFFVKPASEVPWGWLIVMQLETGIPRIWLPSFDFFFKTRK